MDFSVGPLYAARVAILFGTIAAIAFSGRRRHHPFDRFGPANQLTAVRALIVCLVCGFVGERSEPALASAAAGLAIVATAMDGVDGWLARRTRMVSAFGARFDMETDALLILALSVLVWQHAKAGAWVLASGLLRYAFVAAGLVWRWLRAPLPSSRRGRVICIVQIAGLVAALSPLVPWPASAAIAGASLAALGYSFLVDVVALWRRSDR